jgi:shikimate kinase
MPLRGSPRNSRLICLTGFMGAGKSTVGQELARRLGWRFLDLDTRIESRLGLAIPVIFDRLGESVFRQAEFDALSRVLGEIEETARPAILALGGGTYAQSASAGLIQDAGCPVVWLHCSTECLLARCATMTNRPLFRDEASFLSLYRQRLPFYEKADYQVEGNDGVAAVVDRILALGIVEKVNL